jgi:hypothetical protein
MTLRARSRDIESDAVVAELKDDLGRDLLDRDPEIGRLRVLEGVHHTFPGDVVHEQGDRRRQCDLLDVGVEGDA